jgi:hypothetical protein
MRHKVKTLDLSTMLENDISNDVSRVDGIYKETSEYSITPRTFESRILLQIQTDLSHRIDSHLVSLNSKKIQLQKALDNLNLNLTLQAAQKLGVSDGVVTGAQSELTQSKNLQRVLSSLKSKQSSVSDFISQFEKLQSDIATISTEIFFQDQYQHLNKADTRVGPVVHRLGINFASMKDNEILQLFDSGTHYVSSAASTASKTEMKVKLQHPLELFLLEDAVQYLRVNTTKTAILLDILKRDDEGKITIDSNNKPEVHTVVLCKTSKTDEYLVIDPNKVSHSSHIAGTGIHDRDFSIMIPKISDIYTGPKDKTGPKVEQFRDCIDIAVKLALSFEAKGNPIDQDRLDTNEVVQMVSNNADLDKAILKVTGEKAVRIKQRSNTESIKKFHQIEIILDEDIKRLDAIDHGKAVSCKKEYEAKLATTFEPENYGTMVQDLIKLDHDIRQDTITCLGVLYGSKVSILGDSAEE